MSTPFPAAKLGDWHAVAQGVHVLVAEPAGVNLALVVGSDRAVVVDAGSSPAQGRALRAAVGSVTDRPLAAVVATHWHHDHAFGLAGFAGVETIAHESVRPRLASAAAAEEADRLGFAATELALPTRELALAAALDLGGGRRVEVVHLGRGHTDGDLVLVVPDADLVLAGDLVESAGPPSYGADSWAHEWPATLDGLIGLMTATTRAVPGHGSPVDREFVFEQRGRVAAVSGEISRLAGLGVSAEQAESRGTWALPFDAVRPGLDTALAQVRSGPRRPTLPLA
ncbi:MBL fold metallo-hydrolase [Microlunatus ginsengisoli]|uniref:MBL fold metallo-hydrolase n=1 Tax=Microlunatus ginsengisoli TaxID=363863 RepID=UPI0031DB4496